MRKLPSVIALISLIAFAVTACGQPETSDGSRESSSSRENQQASGQSVSTQSLSTYQQPETTMMETTSSSLQKVGMGESFKAQGFEWTFTSAEVQQTRMESTDYADSKVEGPWVVLRGSRTNVSEDYISPDTSGITLYTDQTTHGLDSSLGFTVDYDKNLAEGDLAPGATKEGAMVLPMDSAGETPLYVQFADPDTLEPRAQLNLGRSLPSSTATTSTQQPPSTIQGQSSLGGMTSGQTGVGYNGICQPISGPAQDPDCLHPGAATNNPMQKAYNECVASGKDQYVCGQI